MEKRECKLGRYVVYQDMVCTIQCIWNDGESCDLKRVYPKTDNPIDFPRVPSTGLTYWDGTITHKPH